MSVFSYQTNLTSLNLKIPTLTDSSLAESLVSDDCATCTTVDTSRRVVDYTKQSVSFYKKMVERNITQHMRNVSAFNGCLLESETSLGDIIDFGGIEIPTVGAEKLVLTSDNLRSKIVEMITLHEKRQVVNMMGSTGIGKTTRIPFEYLRVKKSKGIVVLVEPTAILAQATYNLCSKLHPDLVVCLDQGLGDCQIIDGVIITDVNVALNRMLVSQHAVYGEISALFLDEYHTDSPAYDVLKKAVMKYSKVGVTMMSATADSENIVKRVDNLTNVIVEPAVDLTQWSMGHFCGSWMAEIAYGRWLFIVPNDKIVYALYNWLKHIKNKAYVYYMANEMDGDKALRSFMSFDSVGECNAFMIVTTAYGTGFNFNCDRLVDLCYSVDYGYSVSAGLYDSYRFWTSDEKVQRLGRVCRRTPHGKAFIHSDGFSQRYMKSKDRVLRDMYMEMYSGLFNFHIGGSVKVSRERAFTLFSSRVPFVLVAQFVDGKGYWADRYRSAMSVLFKKGSGRTFELPVNLVTEFDFKTKRYLVHSIAKVAFSNVMGYNRLLGYVTGYGEEKKPVVIEHNLSMEDICSVSTQKGLDTHRSKNNVVDGGRRSSGSSSGGSVSTGSPVMATRVLNMRRQSFVGDSGRSESTMVGSVSAKPAEIREEIDPQASTSTESFETFHRSPKCDMVPYRSLRKRSTCPSLSERASEVVPVEVPVLRSPTKEKHHSLPGVKELFQGMNGSDATYSMISNDIKNKLSQMMVISANVNVPFMTLYKCTPDERHRLVSTVPVGDPQRLYFNSIAFDTLEVGVYYTPLLDKPTHDHYLKYSAYEKRAFDRVKLYFDKEISKSESRAYEVMSLFCKAWNNYTHEYLRLNVQVYNEARTLSEKFSMYRCTRRLDTLINERFPAMLRLYNSLVAHKRFLVVYRMVQCSGTIEQWVETQQATVDISDHLASKTCVVQHGDTYSTGLCFGDKMLCCMHTFGPMRRSSVGGEISFPYGLTYTVYPRFELLGNPTVYIERDLAVSNVNSVTDFSSVSTRVPKSGEECYVMYYQRGYDTTGKFITRFCRSEQFRIFKLYGQNRYFSTLLSRVGMSGGLVISVYTHDVLAMLTEYNEVDRLTFFSPISDIVG